MWSVLKDPKVRKGVGTPYLNVINAVAINFNLTLDFLLKEARRILKYESILP